MFGFFRKRAVKATAVGVLGVGVAGGLSACGGDGVGVEDGGTASSDRVAQSSVLTIYAAPLDGNSITCSVPNKDGKKIGMKIVGHKYGIAFASHDDTYIAKWGRNTKEDRAKSVAAITATRIADPENASLVKTMFRITAGGTTDQAGMKIGQWLVNGDQRDQLPKMQVDCHDGSKKPPENANFHTYYTTLDLTNGDKTDGTRKEIDAVIHAPNNYDAQNKLMSASAIDHIVNLAERRGTEKAQEKFFKEPDRGTDNEDPGLLDGIPDPTKSYFEDKKNDVVDSAGNAVDKAKEIGKDWGLG